MAPSLFPQIMKDISAAKLLPWPALSVAMLSKPIVTNASEFPLMDCNWLSALKSSRAADLPSEAGLGWQYGDGKGTWPDDPNLTCTEVRGQQQHDRAGGGKGGGKRARRSGRRATQPTRPAASSFVRFRAHHPLLSRHRPSHPSMAPHASEGYDAHTHASHAHDQHED